MSFLKQYASSQQEYLRMMEMLAQQQMMAPSQYMGTPSLSSCVAPKEQSAVLLLLPRKGV